MGQLCGKFIEPLKRLKSIIGITCHALFKGGLLREIMF